MIYPLPVMWSPATKLQHKRNTSATVCIVLVIYSPMMFQINSKYIHRLSEFWGSIKKTRGIRYAYSTVD